MLHSIGHHGGNDNRKVRNSYIASFAVAVGLDGDEPDIVAGNGAEPAAAAVGVLSAVVELTVVVFAARADIGQAAAVGCVRSDVVELCSDHYPDDPEFDAVPNFVAAVTNATVHVETQFVQLNTVAVVELLESNASAAFEPPFVADSNVFALVLLAFFAAVVHATAPASVVAAASALSSAAVSADAVELRPRVIPVSFHFAADELHFAAGELHPVEGELHCVAGELRSVAGEFHFVVDELHAAVAHFAPLAFVAHRVVR